MQTNAGEPASASSVALEAPVERLRRKIAEFGVSTAQTSSRPTPFWVGMSGESESSIIVEATQDQASITELLKSSILLVNFNGISQSSQ